MIKKDGYGWISRDGVIHIRAPWARTVDRIASIKKGWYNIVWEEMRRHKRDRREHSLIRRIQKRKK